MFSPEKKKTFYFIKLCSSRGLKRENLSSGFPTRSDTNRAVTAIEDKWMLKISDLGIEEEGLYYLCSENKTHVFSCRGSCRLMYYPFLFREPFMMNSVKGMYLGFVPRHKTTNK